MKRRSILFSSVWAGLMTLAWLLAGARAEAAEKPDEKAFSVASFYFSSHLWLSAETNFQKFTKKFPQSTLYADAVLYEAQAIFFQAETNRLRSYKEVVDLLAAEQGRAGDKADAFAYWTAMAWYYTPDAYRLAADTFKRLVDTYPRSDYRPEALYLEADCYARLKDWARVVEKLQPSDGSFQQLAKSNPTNDWVVKGLLLLGKSELTRKNYDSAEAALSELPEQKLKPNLEWQRQDLLCRIKIASGDPEAALTLGTKLVAAAGDDAEARARSFLLLGDIHRDLESFSNALAAYGTNLNPSPRIPMDLRRAALQNSVDLLSGPLNQTINAAQLLRDFLTNYPVENVNSDFDRLMLGELLLKQAYTNADGTNLFSQARTDFEQIISNYPASEYLGKAYLDLGWCLLAETNLPAAQAALSNAVGKLVFSSDRATALFKLADTRYQQGDFAGAIGDYNRILDDYGSLPVVTNNLFEPALYQILRAGIETTNLAAASDALDRILKWFPNGLLGQRSLLLLGEAENREGNAAAARDLFDKFKGQWPDSPLLPQAELAIARTYERQEDWKNAVREYNGWIAGHTNSDALPLAEFSLAWAEFKAGDTNAVRDFSSFATNYPANELTAKALYWLGDYYRQKGRAEGDSELLSKAEINFQTVYRTWPDSDLYCRAQMEAGRTAIMRQGFVEAAKYFTNLFKDPKCPPELKMEAAFACGDANMSSSNFPDARDWFLRVATTYTNDPAAIGTAIRAWGRVGDSCLQLAAQAEPAKAMDFYLSASNAYQMVLSPPLLAQADISTRSLADYGLGQTLEKMARLKTGAERVQLLQEAVDHYLKVVSMDNRRPGEQPDPIVVRDAGLAAGRLLESDELGGWETAYHLYLTMRKELSSMTDLQAVLDRRIENARKHLPPGKGI